MFLLSYLCNFLKLHWIPLTLSYSLECLSIISWCTENFPESHCLMKYVLKFGQYSFHLASQCECFQKFQILKAQSILWANWYFVWFSFLFLIKVIFVHIWRNNFIKVKSIHDLSTLFIVSTGISPISNWIFPICNKIITYIGRLWIIFLRNNVKTFL